jgi:hypothetical protein
LENPESLNKTLSEILDGTKKPCDSLVNTHHIGAETELTNGQSDNVSSDTREASAN